MELAAPAAPAVCRLTVMVLAHFLERRDKPGMEEMEEIYVEGIATHWWKCLSGSVGRSNGPIFKTTSAAP